MRYIKKNNSLFDNFNKICLNNTSEEEAVNILNKLNNIDDKNYEISKKNIFYKDECVYIVLKKMSLKEFMLNLEDGFYE